MTYAKRFYFIIGVLLLVCGGLVLRMLDLCVSQRDFLLQQGNARILRIVDIPAHRGMMTDRNGKPLAVSARVYTIWANPKVYQGDAQQTAALAKILKVSAHYLKALFAKSAKRSFIYLQRGVSPAVAEQVKQLNITGVFLQHTYRRFYPEGAVTAHLVGFTNIDEQGQEGLELAFDTWLQGEPGKKRVVKDRVGQIVADLGQVHPPHRGHDLALSIDDRIQYLAYRELKNTMTQFRAKSGSVVVLDVASGEILAMVNLPTYNPNHVTGAHDGRYRNRAVTDMFEPGSTMKAFSVAAALNSHKYTPKTVFKTSPGYINIDGNIIKDVHDYGTLTLTQVIQKSSNVAMSKMALSLNPDHIWKLYQRFGFGERTSSNFPGEVSGSLPTHQRWRHVDIATMAIGYGVAVTTLQLAQAYAVLAADGVKRPVSLLRVEHAPEGERVLSELVAEQVKAMLAKVTQRGGTGRRARVSGYHVAGKTGTAYIAGQNGYKEKRYVASFVGMAPLKTPRLVVAVVVREPKKAHYGGLVAAPIFSKVMAGALRLLAITPDDLSSVKRG